MPRDLIEVGKNKFGVQVDDELGVATYIHNHYAVSRALEPACEIARRYFGAGADMTLGRFVSQEDPSDQFLFLNVRLATYPDDMLDRLRRAQSEVLRRAGGGECVVITSAFA